MSNQESMFADQEQQPDGEQQPYNAPVANADPRPQPRDLRPEQESLRQGEYEAGYAGSSNTDPREQPWQEGPAHEEHMGPQRWNSGKVYPQVQPRGQQNAQWLWVFVAIFVFFFALAGGMGASFGSSDRQDNDPGSSMMAPSYGHQPYGQQQSNTSTFDIPSGVRPMLMMNVNASAVHIQAVSNATSITVVSSGTSNGLDASMRNNIVDIQGENQGRFMGENDGATIDITAPAGTDIQLRSDEGQVSITGMDGQMNVQTTRGDINITQTTLRGQSLLRTDAGSISFDGALDQNGTYVMASDEGAIDVTLPSTAAFDLNGDITALTTNDFGGNAVGNGPQPPLTLQSNSGSISLHKAA